MPRLRDATSIGRSAGQTTELLERLLAGLCDKDGVARVRLRVPAGSPADRSGFYSYREVNVEIGAGCAPLAISWVPELPLVFPSFHGTLAVRGDGDTSQIVLDGSHAPPPHVSGQSFDVAVGSDIARAIARELLAKIKRGVDRMQ